MSWEDILKADLKTALNDFFNFMEQIQVTSVLDRNNVEKILKKIKNNLDSLKDVMRSNNLYNPAEKGKKRILVRIEDIEEEYEKKEPDYDDIHLFLEDLKDNIYDIIEEKLQ